MALDQRIAAGAALALFALTTGTAHAAPEPFGVWMNDTGRGAIEIKPCGNGLCGHVVWVQDPKDAEGCGKQIIGDAVEVSRGTWDGGWIYSPERKRRYDVELKPLDGQRLQVTGYAGSKFFSKSMVWTRAPADISKCGAQQAAVEPEAKSSAPRAGERMPERATEVPPPSRPERAPPASEATQPEQQQRQAEAPAGAGKKLELGDLQLDKFLKRLPNGECLIDTPWARVQFPCEKR